MTRVVYVSRIGRRLRERGIAVSRGALDRLVSERPLDDVRLGVVLPILEEVDLDFRDAFERLSAHEAEERAGRARLIGQAAGQLNRGPAEPTAAAAAPDVEAELAEALARSQALLRERLPEVFDKRGRLRRKRLEEAIAARLSGRSDLTRDDFLALTADLGLPPTSPSDAP